MMVQTLNNQKIAQSFARAGTLARQTVHFKTKTPSIPSF
jgi:hypothetical protein